MITASDGRRRGFLPPRRRRGACCCYPPLVLGAALEIGKSKLELAKIWRLKAWWKARSTYGFVGLVKRSWPLIVVHILRNLESGEVSLTDSPSGRLEFKLSHIRLIGSAKLRSECYSGIALFDHGYWINRPELQTKSCREKGNAVYKRQCYKDG
jgi:hypothetical protein